jgi:ferritin-like metal-binding protein YciE
MAKTQATQSEKTLGDLFHETLKDIYFAEKQILKALPKMAREANAPELKKAFETHRDETEGHVERLQQIFEQLDKPARGKTCDAILGIVEEGKEIMEEFARSEALDAGLVGAAQAVEHYEIARYGTLKAWAGQLGLRDAEKLLDLTLQEEMKTDKLLSELATRKANARAAA